MTAGGSTAIPSIGRALKLYFDKQPLATHAPDQVIALGASIAAGLQAGDREALSIPHRAGE